MPDYYAILGVPTNARDAEIAKAYRALAARYHPDRHEGNALQELAKEKLAQINEAYAVLSHFERRADYDRQRRVSSPGTAGAAPGTVPKDVSLTRTMRGVMLALVLLVAGFFSLRLVRSPRSMAIIGGILLLAWFGPRLLRLFRGGKG